MLLPGLELQCKLLFTLAIAQLNQEYILMKFKPKELMKESMLPWASWSWVMKCTHAQLGDCVCAPPDACHELHESKSWTFPVYFLTKTGMPKILGFSTFLPIIWLIKGVIWSGLVGTPAWVPIFNPQNLKKHSAMQ